MPRKGALGLTTVLYPDRPVMDAVQFNVVSGRIVENSLQPGLRRLRVRLPNGGEIEVRYPAYTYRPLNLAIGQEVRLSLRKEALVVLGRP